MSDTQTDQSTEVAPVDIEAGAGQAGMLAVIERAAGNPNVDTDKMQSLLDMQLQIMDKQAEIEFNKAMTGLRSELGPVVKNKANNQTSSRYADLETIKKAVDPLLVKYGFFDSYDDDFPEDGVIITTCILTHESGHARRNKVRFKRDSVGIKGSTNKTDVHGDASTMTYGQRLSLCRALGLRISEDDDGNKAGAKPIGDKQAAGIKKLLEETGSDVKGFLDLFGIDCVESMDERDVRKANALLLTRKEGMKAEEVANDKA